MIQVSHIRTNNATTSTTIMPPHQFGLRYENAMMMDNDYSSSSTTNAVPIKETPLYPPVSPSSSSYHSNGKRNIRFELTSNEIFLIPHINDMTDDEVLWSWYEKHEYDQLKQDMIPIVKRMMKGDKIEETDDMTIRGLEYRTRKGAIKRQHNKVEAITAVLDEQDRQMDKNTNDPELLRQAYLEISIPCHRDAHDLALADEVFAREYQGIHIFLDYASDDGGNTSDDGDASVDPSSGTKRQGRRRGGIRKVLQSMRVRSKAATMSPCPSRSSSPIPLRIGAQ